MSETDNEERRQNMRDMIIGIISLSIMFVVGVLVIVSAVSETVEVIQEEGGKKSETTELVTEAIEVEEDIPEETPVTTRETEEPEIIYEWAVETVNSPERYYLDGRQFNIVCSIVEGEAGDQDIHGKMLVAQCILNACEKDNLTPEEVRRAYQYAGWSESYTDETAEAVVEVFTYGHMPTEAKILYFYDARYCNSAWHETQKFALEYGCHRFFEEA